MSAAVLGSVGLYGVTAYSVVQRTRELGVRVALGARPGDVMRLVLRQGMLLAFCGLLLGLAGAMALTGLLSHLLYGTAPRDPMTFAGVALLLLFVSLCACYLPAYRATRVNPMVVLRNE